MRLTLLVLCFLVPVSVLAHEGGLSFEETIGEYVVDIWYNSSPLIPNERAVFDFALRTVKGEPIAFEYVWVRLLSEGEVLLATGIARPAYGATTVAYLIPTNVHAPLTIEARFYDTDKMLAEAEFSLPVATSWYPYALSTGIPIALVLVGSLLIMYVQRRRTIAT